jgi:hypothetical protein
MATAPRTAFRTTPKENRAPASRLPLNIPASHRPRAEDNSSERPRRSAGIAGLFAIGALRDIIVLAVRKRSTPLSVWKNIARKFTKALFIAIGLTLWTGLVVLFSFVVLILVKFS